MLLWCRPKQGEAANAADARCVMTQDVGFKYTDTVFRLLFSDKARLMSLYNAICSKSPSRHCENPALISAKLIEAGICVEVQGDGLLFVADNVNLYVRHTLWSPNIMLFFFNYYVAELKRTIMDQMSYVTDLDSMPFPHPCFAVLYNGDAQTGDKQLLKFSDLYRKDSAANGANAQRHCALEMIGEAYNVNAGHSGELLASCDALKGYAEFVRRVREALQANTRVPVDEVVERTVDSCISDGVLADFLQANRRDVIAIGTYEFDTGERERHIREAYYEDGQRDLLCELVKEGHIPLSVAAKKAHQSEEDFARDMKRCS